MSIIKVKKTKNYTVIDNHAIKNPLLSWGAKGLLTYLMSLPDDWKVRKTELCNNAKNGRDSTIKLFNELEQHGYITKEKETGGKFGFIFSVSDKPLLKTRNGETVTENQKLISKDKLSNKLDNYKSKENKDTPTKEEIILKSKYDELTAELEYLKEKQKVTDKKPGRQFPKNEPRKKYKVPQQESAAEPQYKIFSKNYDFSGKGWSDELIKEFFVYCQIRHETGRFSSTQMKLVINEVNEALSRHELDDILNLIKAAQKGKRGAWASFEFSERIAERKRYKRKKEAQKHNAAENYDAVREQLNEGNFFNIK